MSKDKCLRHPRSSSPSTTMIWPHPWTKAVASSTIYQEIQEETRLYFCNKHADLIPAVDPAINQKLAPAPLSHGLGAPIEHCLRECLCSGSQCRSCSTPLKQTSLDTLEMFREKIWLYPIHPPTRQNSLVPSELPRPVISPCWRTWEYVSECLAAPAVWDIAKEVYFSLMPHPEYWVVNCITGGRNVLRE